jgi:hypothetical protein
MAEIASDELHGKGRPRRNRQVVCAVADAAEAPPMPWP